MSFRQTLKSHTYANQDQLILEITQDTYDTLGELRHLSLYYRMDVFDHKQQKSVTHRCGLQYFHLDDLALAQAEYQRRLRKEARIHDFSLEAIHARTQTA